MLLGRNIVVTWTALARNAKTTLAPFNR